MLLENYATVQQGLLNTWPTPSEAYYLITTITVHTDNVAQSPLRSAYSRLQQADCDSQMFNTNRTAHRSHLTSDRPHILKLYKAGFLQLSVNYSNIANCTNNRFRE